MVGFLNPPKKKTKMLRSKIAKMPVAMMSDSDIMLRLDRAYKKLQSMTQEEEVKLRHSLNNPQELTL